MKEQQILEISSVCVESSPHGQLYNQYNIFEKEGIKLTFSKFGKCIGGYHVSWQEKITYQQTVDVSNEYSSCEGIYPIHHRERIEFDKERIYLVSEIIKLADEKDIFKMSSKTSRTIKRKGKTFIRDVYTLGEHVVGVRYSRKIGRFVWKHFRNIKYVRKLKGIIEPKL